MNYKDRLLELQDLIWAAGFFDGEGHIDIAIYKSNPNGILVVSVSQNKLHSDILDLFSHWGGSVFPANKVGLWRWQACSLEARKFLKDILPYLKLKSKAAELAIDFQNTMHHRGSKQQLAEVEKQQRQMLINKFREIQPARRNKAFLKVR